MQASELLTVIAERGASIRATGDRLHVTGDNLLDDELRGQIRQFKPAILALLQSAATGRPEYSPTTTAPDLAADLRSTPLPGELMPDGS